MRRTIIVILSLVGSIALALTIVPKVYHEELEKMALEKINGQVKAKVSFAHLHASVWNNFPDLTIIIEDISVAPANRTAADTLLTASEISLSIDTWDFLVDGHIGLKSISVKDPLVNAHVFRNGSNNFSLLVADSSEKEAPTDSTFSMHLQKVEVVNGYVSWLDETTDTRMLASNVSFKGKGEFSDKVYDLITELQANEVLLQYHGDQYFSDKDIALNLLLTVDRVRNQFRIKESRASVNAFTFNLDGEVALKPQGIALNCKFSSPQAEFKDVLSLASFFKNNLTGIQAEGKVDFNGFIKGTYLNNLDSVPKFEVTLNIEDASLKADTIPEAIEDINLKLSMRNDTGIADSLQIEMDSIHFKVRDHSITGHAHLHGLTHSRIDANLQGSIHFQELMEIYPIPGIDLEGEVDFSIVAEGIYKNTALTFEVPDIDVNIDVRNGKFKYDSLKDSLNNIHLNLRCHSPQGDWNNAVIVVNNIKMNIGDDPVEGRMSFKNLSNPTVEAFIKTSIHLEDIQHVFPMDGIEMKGNLSTEINVNGTYNKTKNLFPRVDASFAITNGFLKSTAYPRPMESVHLIADLNNTTGLLEETKLDLKQFTYTLDGDSFEVTGVIKDFKRYAYDLKVKGLVDLYKLTQIYPLEGLELAGRIRSDVEVQGTIADLEAGDYEKTVANGNIFLNDVSISGKLLPQSIVIKSAAFGLTPEVIRLNNLEARSGNSTFSLKGELMDYFCFFKNDGDLVTATLKLDSDTLDLNDWRAWFAVDEKTSSQKTSSIIKIPLTIDFDFDSNIKFLRYDDMTITNLEGEITLKDGVMKAKETGFNSLNARFFASGEYDSRDSQHPLFNFDLKIEELDIQRAYKDLRLVRELVPAAADASGLFSIQYKIKGELDNTMFPKTETIIGGGDIHIADAKVNGMKIFDRLSKKAKKKEMNDPHLKDFTMTTEIRNNKIFVKPFEIKVSGWNTRIEGVNNISGTINYLIKVELFPIEKLGVPFHVTGTYDNPIVALGKGARLPDETAVAN